MSKYQTLKYYLREIVPQFDYHHISYCTNE